MPKELYVALLIVLVLSFLVQMYYWAILFRIIFNINDHTKTNELKVKTSLIIAGKNESKNIEQFHRSWIKQEDVKLEIIYCDDQSTDGSGEILERINNNYTNFKNILIPPEEKGGKKNAVAKAISYSNTENLIFLDADCKPASQHWAKIMSSSLNEKKKIAIGYGPYFKENSLLNKWIRFETYISAIQYFSWTLRGKPYMAVGRNMAYHKSLYQSVGGFEKHESIQSGDDDLFIRDAAKAENIVPILDPMAFVYSTPKKNLRAYIHQKKRHLSTGKYYKKGIKYRLAFFSLSQFSFFLVVFILLFSKVQHIAIISLILRWFLLMMLNKKYLKRFKEDDLLRYLPFLDVCLFFYYLGFAPYVFLKGNQKW